MHIEQKWWPQIRLHLSCCNHAATSHNGQISMRAYRCVRASMRENQMFQQDVDAATSGNKFCALPCTDMLRKRAWHSAD